MYKFRIGNADETSSEGIATFVRGVNLNFLLKQISNLDYDPDTEP